MKKKGDRISLAEDFAEPLREEITGIQCGPAKPRLTISAATGRFLSRKLRVASSEIKSPVSDTFAKPVMLQTLEPEHLLVPPPKPMAQANRPLPPLPIAQGNTPTPSDNRISILSDASTKRSSLMSQVETASSDEDSLLSFYRDEPIRPFAKELPPVPTKTFTQQEVRNYDNKTVEVVDTGVPPQVPKHFHAENTNEYYIKTRTEVVRHSKPVENLDTAIFTRKSSSKRPTKSYGNVRLQDSITECKERTASEDYLAQHGLVPFMLAGYQDHSNLRVVNRVTSSSSTVH